MKMKSDIPDYAEILHNFFIFVKEKALEMVDDFASENADIMSQALVFNKDLDFAYFSYLELKKAVFQEMEECLIFIQ